MRLNRLIKNVELLCLIVLFFALTGCANKPLVFYPIQPTDFHVEENGDVVMSERYFKEVLNATVEEF